MKKIAALLSATMMFNMLATTGYAYEMDVNEGVFVESEYAVLEDTTVTENVEIIKTYAENEEQVFGDWDLDLKYLYPVGTGN